MKALNHLGLVLALLAAMGLWLVLTALPGAAATQCGDRDDMLRVLADRFGETPIGMGLAANGGLLELFASPETGSWSITITVADGAACLVASGQNWETAGRPVTPPGVEG